MLGLCDHVLPFFFELFDVGLHLKLKSVNNITEVLDLSNEVMVLHFTDLKQLLSVVIEVINADNFDLLLGSYLLGDFFVLSYESHLFLLESFNLSQELVGHFEDLTLVVLMDFGELLVNLGINMLDLLVGSLPQGFISALTVSLVII